MWSRLSRGTGLRVPPCGIGQFLEVGASRELSREVLAIFDSRRDEEIRITILFTRAVKVFCDDRIATVRYAILLKVAGLHMACDDLQVSTSVWRGLPTSPAAASGKFPLRDGITLPRRISAGGLPVAEVKQPGLCSRVTCCHFPT